MRDILFKAKRIDNGEWVEGYYCEGTCNSNCGISLIITDLNVEIPYRSVLASATDIEDIRNFDIYEVDEETICQYTGLTDKNGNKIWENDIVKYTDDLINKEKTVLIEFNETHASFVRLYKSKMGLQYLYINESIANNCEVIGNIFDNPELLNADKQASKYADNDVMKPATY